MTTRAVEKEVIGARIASARILQRWLQADLAQALRARTGEMTWTDKKISKIERGELAVDSHVLSVFAEIQGQEISWYYEPLPSYTEPPEAPDASGAMGPYRNWGRPGAVNLRLLKEVA